MLTLYNGTQQHPVTLCCGQAWDQYRFMSYVCAQLQICCYGSLTVLTAFCGAGGSPRVARNSERHRSLVRLWVLMQGGALAIFPNRVNYRFDVPESKYLSPKIFLPLARKFQKYIIYKI